MDKRQATDIRSVTGFDWDAGNSAKCQKHGISTETIEELFSRTISVEADPSSIETRFRAIGGTRDGRMVFLVFTLRERSGEQFIRPISARYMHRKEIGSYEKENPGVQE